MSSRLVLALACLLVSIPLPLVAQQTSDAAPDASGAVMTLHTSTRIVNLPIVVRDKHGRIMGNLQKDDLLLTEDGKPQTIRYFDQDANEALTLGLLVDVSGSVQNSLDSERDASKDFLHHLLGPQDKAFIEQFGHEVDLLANPTGDRDVLMAALKKLAPIPVSNTSNTDDSNTPVHHGGTQLYDAVFLATDEVMKTESNRKAIILLTDGEDTASMESLEQAVESAQRADTIVYAIYYHSAGGGSPWQRPVHMGGGDHGHGSMGRNNGGQDNGHNGGYGGHHREHVDGHAVLERMTKETGGDLFEVSMKESIPDIYKKIDEELRNQYRLGYTPPAHAEPGYHPVTVVAKDSTLTVQTRSGYYSGK